MNPEPSVAAIDVAKHLGVVNGTVLSVAGAQGFTSAQDRSPVKVSALRGW